MWRSTLSISFLPFIFITCFYLVLIGVAITQFYATFFDSFLSAIVLLLILDWWRSLSYFLTIKGEFALFHNINQIYWHQQRWYLCSKPLLLRYAVVLKLKSRRNGAYQTLFLVSHNFNSDDWRRLHYHLRQID